MTFDDRAYTHICWNTTRPHLADPRVRTALTMAIDRETLADVVYGGYARIGVGPVLSSFWAFNPELEPVPFDPAHATGLLAEAGWTDSDDDGLIDHDGDPLTIELLAPAENQLRQDVAILVQKDLKRIGIRVEPRFVEWGTLLAAMHDSDFDGVVNKWEEPTRVDLEEIWASPVEGEFSPQLRPLLQFRGRPAAQRSRRAQRLRRSETGVRPHPATHRRRSALQLSR